jgi:internalin A
MSLEEALRRIHVAIETHSPRLDLTGCNLDAIPSILQQMTWIKILLLDSCYVWQRRIRDNNRGNITGIPTWIGDFKNLTIFSIHGHHLQTLPPELCALTQLTNLVVSSNWLTSLPPEICHLTQLTDLDVGSSRLTRLPPEIGQLTRLRTLHVHGNQLTSLPPEIGQLTRLRTLHVHGNQLTSLPPEIGQLTNLTELDLSHNQLLSLPSSLAALTRLTNLVMNNNQLMGLPPEIGHLVQLRTLHAADNQLPDLPPELATLTQLAELDISNNPLTIPDELISTHYGLSLPLRSYLRQCAEAGTHTLNEAKLIVIGQGNVGKTSLVRRLVNDVFNPEEAKTEGIAIDRWQIQIDRQNVRINIWDFGGQEIMHATHQFFLTKRSIYLLVLHCREDDHSNRLDYWLKLIQSFAPDAPIIVVGNQADQHPFDVDQRILVAKYPQIQAFVATSCAIGQGIDVLKSEIMMQLQTLRHIHDVLPAAWWRVKQQLEDWKGREYLSHERFQDLCTDQGIDDDQTQQVLLGVLNDLGIALSYHNDPRLADTKVLNPAWVTQGVYTILNYPPLIIERSGVVASQGLSAILSIHGRRYPLQKCLFIMDMMAKFELCFPIDHDRWLIPDLLPREAPDTGDWTDALQFVYHYPVLPTSIIARFMVRSQHAIVGNLCWRTGVVLEADEARARIAADLDAAQIDIRITGEASSRRRLLSAIRYTFEPIHHSLSGLQDEIQEWVPLPDHPNDLVEYQELLGLEAMGETHYLDGKLRKRFPLIQLLDGYETFTERQARQVDDYGDASIDHLVALIEVYRAHLEDNELKQAHFSPLYTPYYITAAINDLRSKIEHLQILIRQRRERDWER